MSAPSIEDRQLTQGKREVTHFLGAFTPEQRAVVLTHNPHLVDRLGGEAKDEQREQKEAPAGAPAKSSSGPSPTKFLSDYNRLSSSIGTAVPGRVPGSSSAAGRLIVALFLGIIVLEVVSYLTGQYFNFDWAQLGKAPKTIGQNLVYLGAYKGQKADQAALKAEATAAAGAAAHKPQQSFDPLGSHGVQVA